MKTTEQKIVRITLNDNDGWPSERIPIPEEGRIMFTDPTLWELFGVVAVKTEHDLLHLTFHDGVIEIIPWRVIKKINIRGAK